MMNMKKHLYTILYIAFLSLLAIGVLVFEMSDIAWMILAVLALIVTSIYTYSTRKK